VKNESFEIKTEPHQNEAPNDDTGFKESQRKNQSEHVSYKNFLDKEKNKLRITDPKNVFTFRNEKRSYLRQVILLITLVYSLPLSLLFLFSFLLYEGELRGIGEISHATPLEMFSGVFVFGFICFKSFTLFKIRDKSLSKSYKFEMFTNSLGRFVISNLKFLVILYAIYALICYGSSISMEELMVPSRGPVEHFNIVLFTAVISINALNAFKYCGRL